MSIWADYRSNTHAGLIEPRRDCVDRTECRVSSNQVSLNQGVYRRLSGVLKRVRRGGQAGGRSAPARCSGRPPERRRPPGPCLTRKNVSDFTTSLPLPRPFTSRAREHRFMSSVHPTVLPPLRTVTFNRVSSQPRSRCRLTVDRYTTKG
jgi:hypothetical protein